MRAILGFCAVALNLNVHAITILTEGLGTVSPDLTGKNLIGGRTYTLTAKPHAGYAFDYWEVDADQYNSQKLSITLLNGLLFVKDGTKDTLVGAFDSTITAHFGAKPIVPGTYVSINTDTVNTYATFRVSPDGAFSAKAFFEGEWHSFSGKFSRDGTAHSTLRHRNLKIGLTLNIVYYDSPIAIYADFDNYAPDSQVTWLGAYLVSSARGSQMTGNYAGKYTVIMPGDDADLSVPKGDGFATVKISSTGRLLAAGTLGDGTPFTQSILVSTSSYSVQWPVFLVLKGGSENLAGTIDFYAAAYYVDGGVIWEKSPETNSSSYPEGFRDQMLVTGEHYLPPNIRWPEVMENTNLLISFDGGTLPIHFAATATLTSDQRVVVDDSTNQIAITIQSNNGLFTGTATPPGQTDPIQFQGAVQGDNIIDGYFGSGFFLKDNLSGRIKIEIVYPYLNGAVISNTANSH